MSPAPFLAPGPDGDEPSLPGDVARNDADTDDSAPDVAHDTTDAADDRADADAAGDRRDADAASPSAASSSAVGPPQAVVGPPPDGADDYDADADLARWLDDIDSGREPIPSDEDLRAPAVMFTFGQAGDVDPAVLAAMAGPDGLGGQAFTQQQMTDAMPPGPLLAALTENAAADVRGLSDEAVLGVISAARRLAARAEFLELAGIAEFTVRRQGQLAASAARKDPRGQRAGEFADAELGMHLQISGREAGNRMDQAVALTTRLPRTFAGLGAGTITADNAYSIWFYTRFLSDADAAEADAILAAAAPGIKQDTLAAKAAKLEMTLDPDAARARKEHARKEARRVEARRELSGNMSYAGRELAAEEALAVSAAVEADAAALRRAGMDGSIRDLRVACFLDRLLGRNPFDRLPASAPAPASTGDPAPGHPAAAGTGASGSDPGTTATDDPGTSGSAAPGTFGSAAPGTFGSAASAGDPGSDPAPFPALINLLVPAGTALGWSTTPGEAGRWGLLDPWDTRRLLQAASAHPRTRWCVTAVGPDGTAVAHGCSRGPHRWTPPPPATATATPTRRSLGAVIGHHAALGHCVGTAADLWTAATWITGMDLTTQQSYQYQEIYTDGYVSPQYNLSLTGTGAGAKTVLAGDSQLASQVWTDRGPSGRVGNPDGSMSLRPLSNQGLCLTVPGGKYASGQQLAAEPCTGNLDQEFFRMPSISFNGAQQQELVPYGDGELCLGMPKGLKAGAAVTLLPCSRTQAQAWNPMEAWYLWGGEPAGVNAYPLGVPPQRMLTVSSLPGTSATAATAPFSIGSTSLAWFPVTSSDGTHETFRLAARTGWCLDATTTAVTAQACNGATSQEFTFSSEVGGDGISYLQLKAATAPGSCVSAGTGSGTVPVTLTACAPGVSSQMWYVYAPLQVTGLER